MDEAHSLYSDKLPDVTPYVRSGTYANFRSLRIQYWMVTKTGWLEVARASVFENGVPKDVVWRRRCFFEAAQGSIRVNGSCTDYFLGTQCHRTHSPSRVVRTGHFIALEYRELGHRHREGKPSVMMFQDGKLVFEQWNFRNRFHRLDGPAVIYNGKLYGPPAEQLANFALLREPIREWFVEDEKLDDFEKYFDPDNAGESVMQYVRAKPEKCSSLIKLGIANKWLSQCQLDVLDTLNTFRR